MLKFRTMTDRRDASAHSAARRRAPHRPRTVPAAVRASTSSPSWSTCVAGDMSLVGPRPLLMEYLPLYTPEQARRHDVRPGITGWAQVNGRNALTWDEKFALDVWYVDHRSLRLDSRSWPSTVVAGVRRPRCDRAGARDHGTVPGEARA